MTDFQAFSCHNPINYFVNKSTLPDLQLDEKVNLVHTKEGPLPIHTATSCECLLN